MKRRKFKMTNAERLLLGAAATREGHKRILSIIARRVNCRADTIRIGVTANPLVFTAIPFTV